MRQSAEQLHLRSARPASWFHLHVLQFCADTCGTALGPRGFKYFQRLIVYHVLSSPAHEQRDAEHTLKCMYLNSKQSSKVLEITFPTLKSPKNCTRFHIVILILTKDYKKKLNSGSELVFVNRSVNIFAINYCTYEVCVWLSFQNICTEQKFQPKPAFPPTTAFRF